MDRARLEKKVRELRELLANERAYVQELENTIDQLRAGMDAAAK